MNPSPTRRHASEGGVKPQNHKEVSADAHAAAPDGTSERSTVEVAGGGDLSVPSAFVPSPTPEDEALEKAVRAFRQKVAPVAGCDACVHTPPDGPMACEGHALRAAVAREQEAARSALASRFWDMVQRGGAEECWPWQGRSDLEGYGRFVFGKHERLAHRIAYELHHGAPIGPRVVLVHRCRNRLCVNPLHLTASTVQESNAATRAAGRNARGEDHGHAQLSEEEVREIIRRRAMGEKVPALAEEYGVSPRHIYYITSGKKWAHITASSSGQNDGEQ